MRSMNKLFWASLVVLTSMTLMVSSVALAKKTDGSCPGKSCEAPGQNKVESGDDVSPEGFYNLGVVYYELGDFEAAEQAFQSALEINPDFKVASTNLEVVIKVRDSIQMALGLTTKASTETKYKPKEFQEYNESPDEKDSAQKSDEKYDGKGDVQEMETKEVDEDTIDVFDFDENAVIDKDAAKQTLLRQMKEDPALFLRRKFAYQIRNRVKKVKKQKVSW